MNLRTFAFAVFFASLCSYGFAQTPSAQTQISTAPLIASFDQPGQFEEVFEKPKESRISVPNLKQAPNGGISGGCLQVTSHTAPPFYIGRAHFELAENTPYCEAISWKYDEDLIQFSDSGYSLMLGWFRALPLSGRLAHLELHLAKGGRSAHQTLWISGTGKDQKISAVFNNGHWYRTQVQMTLLSRNPAQLRMSVSTTDCGVNGASQPIDIPELSFVTEREIAVPDSRVSVRPGLSVGKEGGISCVDNLFASPLLNNLVAGAPVPAGVPQEVVTQVSTVPAQAPPQPSQQGGLVLDRTWNSPIQGGSATMEDLGVLLSPFAKPSTNTSPSPNLEIYEGVTYLMPYDEARKKINLQQKIISKNKVVCPGFPKDSFFHYAFDGNFEGHFNKLYIVVDRADQVVAIQLVSESPKMDSSSVPYKQTDWHAYNFVNSRTKASKRLWIDHKQFFLERNQWTEYRATSERRSKSDLNLLRIDSLLFNPDLTNSGYRGNNWKALEAVRLYLPRPMMELILHVIQSNGH